MRGYTCDMIKSALASSMLVAAFVAAPASAHPLVIASLSVDTLLPSPVRSGGALANAYRAHRVRYDDASRKLGLSSTERALVDEAFESGRARLVVVPRHLDAMSEYRDGRVQVLRDVVIPANEHGYAAAVQEPGGVLTAYIPSVCGNLSYVRTPRRLVAAARATAAPQSRVAQAAVAEPVQPVVAPAPPSYAISGGAPSYAVRVPAVMPVPVVVYAVPSYAVRVYAGPRYVRAPRYIVRPGYFVRPRYVGVSRIIVRDREVYRSAPRSAARYAPAPYGWRERR